MKQACEELHLSQPALSAQLKALEESLDEKLFARVGRNLVLTDVGRVAFRYADDIFSLGQELTNTLKGRPSHRPLRLVVGLAEVVPKIVAYELLKSAFQLPEPVQIVCWEGRLERLMSELAIHALDVVLSDTPAPPTIKVQAHSHYLGDSGVTLFAVPTMAKKYRRDFPHSLDGAPFLLPTSNAPLRRGLDSWFTKNGIRPQIVGEFEDGATMKAFGQVGMGIFPGTSVVARDIAKQFGVRKVGEVDDLRERFYAISVDRRLSHPGVVAISESARKKILSEKN